MQAKSWNLELVYPISQLTTHFCCCLSIVLCDDADADAVAGIGAKGGSQRELRRIADYTGLEYRFYE